MYTSYTLYIYNTYSNSFLKNTPSIYKSGVDPFELFGCGRTLQQIWCKRLTAHTRY